MTDSPDIEITDQLIEYLRSNRHIAADESPNCHVLAGGVSNKTVLVERESGEAWVLKQALAKLRVQVDWFSDPTRIHREAAGLRTLHDLAPKGTITPLVFEDKDHHIIAMQAVAQPHENWKTLLFQGDLQADHVDQFARLLGEIHCQSHEERETLRRTFVDRQFFESLRLEPYFGYAAEQTPSARDFLHLLITDTRLHQHALVHGDYSPKNILVHEGKLVLLDHEVIHWGDPAFDVGFSMTHLLSKAHYLTQHRKDFAAAALAYWERYVGIVGKLPWADELEARAVRQLLGCLLARVAGRSPLEYLDEAHRQRQAAVTTNIMHDPPTRMDQLIERFIEGLENATD